MECDLFRTQCEVFSETTTRGTNDTPEASAQCKLFVEHCPLAEIPARASTLVLVSADGTQPVSVVNISRLTQLLRNLFAAHKKAVSYQTGGGVDWKKKIKLLLLYLYIHQNYIMIQTQTQIGCPLFAESAEQCSIFDTRVSLARYFDKSNTVLLSEGNPVVLYKAILNDLRQMFVSLLK